VKDYFGDRAWSDKFIPLIKQIVGPLLLEPTKFTEDTSEVTDLIVLMAKDMRIAARMRRFDAGYSEQYPFDFTLRSNRSSGARTELRKVVDGWGDWLFYGHGSSESSLCIPRWMIIDLHAFRAHLIRDGMRGTRCLKHGEIPNKDKKTKFYYFNIKSFPPSPPLLIASSFNLNEGIAA